MLNNFQEHENSPDVVTGIIRVFDFFSLCIVRPRREFVFLTPYVAMNFESIPEQLSEPFSVFTLVGEPILSERVY